MTDLRQIIAALIEALETCEPPYDEWDNEKQRAFNRALDRAKVLLEELKNDRPVE